MEPTWRGPRFETVCADCGRKIVTSVDITSIPPSSDYDGANASSAEVRAFRETVRVMTCPYCGSSEARAASSVFCDGDLLRVLSERAARRTPKRWRAAIIRDAGGTYSLKRIVGTPGECVTIRNGDAWIDGAPARRSSDQIWTTAAVIHPTAETRASDRLFLTRVTNVRETLQDGTTQIEAVPTAISNESSTPSFNGGASVPTELVRDFLARFNWDATGVGGGRFTMLARRPDRAWCLEFFATRGKIVARSIPLEDGQSLQGLPFEELSEADFADVEPLVARFPASQANATLGVSVALVDGELIFAIDDEEIAKFDLGDAASDVQAPISTPFVILGDASRASSFKIYRDLHYSSIAESDSVTPTKGYYVLGDNSPASLDSRSPEVGAIPVENVQYIVAKSGEFH